MEKSIKKIRIMGIKGIPGRHGGFETFAEDFSVYLAKNGWNVEVYCQVSGGEGIIFDQWCGVTRINIPVYGTGPLASAIFDAKAIIHSLHSRDPVLTLGYNTAIFNILHRALGIPNAINMDGIEWKREKWNFFFKIWFFINEILACWLGTKLIADHPHIQRHLEAKVSSKKITMIPYASPVISTGDIEILSKFSLKQNCYCILIARPEPENSILEIVRSFSRRKRGFKLVVLGDYSARVAYQAKVLNAASDEVVFLGAIYEKSIVQSLRFYARFYVHGHTVGGTNPSLVEAMGVGSAVLAHDNHFNRWVTADQAYYFNNEDQCDLTMSQMITDDQLISNMRRQMRNRHEEAFTLDRIHRAYEDLLRSLITP